MVTVRLRYGCHQQARFEAATAERATRLRELARLLVERDVDFMLRRPTLQTAATCSDETLPEVFELVRKSARAARDKSMSPIQDPPTGPGVYVVRNPRARNQVKIGRARDIRARLVELQTAHAEPVELLAVLSLDPKDEREFHKRFAEHRISREWFRFTAPIRAACRAARAT